MKKFVLAIFLMLVFFGANAGTKVIFLNGGGNADAGLISVGQTAFREAMIKNGVNEKDVIFEIFPIIAGLADSAASLKCQQSLSLSAFPKKLTRPSAEQFPEYYRALGGYYNNLDVSVSSECAYSFAGYKKLKTVTESLFEKTKKIISDGDSIVLVGHSQGSHYAEAVYAMHFSLDSVTTEKKIKVVNYGSMAVTMPNHRYVNIKQDAVVYTNAFLQFFGLGASWPFIYPYNIDACVANCSKTATSDDLTAVGADEVGHRRQTYLNENIFSLADKKSLPRKIADMVNDSIFEINEAQLISDWFSWDGERWTKDSITTVDGGITNAREFGGLIYKLPTPVDGDNFVFEIKARWNPSLSGYSGKDIAVSLDNRYSSGQVDSSNQPKITRSVQANFRTNGWSDIITINSDAGPFQKFIGTTNTVDWHVYKVETYNRIVSVYVDRSLKYTYPYSGIVGKLDTFSAAALAGIAIDPGSLKVSQFK